MRKNLGCGSQMHGPNLFAFHIRKILGPSVSEWSIFQSFTAIQRELKIFGVWWIRLVCLQLVNYRRSP